MVALTKTRIALPLFFFKNDRNDTIMNLSTQRFDTKGFGNCNKIRHKSGVYEVHMLKCFAQ